MDKLIIAKGNRARAKDKRYHLLVSPEIFDAVKRAAEKANRTVYDTTQILLEFALDRVAEDEQ